MRKLSKLTGARKQRHGADAEPAAMQQREAIIPSWPSLVAVDLVTLLSEQAAEATVTSGSTCSEPTQQGSDHRIGMVTLSDRTQVRFATIGRFTVIQSSRGIDFSR